MVTYADGHAYVDGYKFRKDTKTGYYLASKPINGKRLRLHVYVWESNNGKVPAKYQVHHMDKDKQNNEPENFELRPIKDHLSLHATEITEVQREKRLKNILEKAIPAAREWHGTKVGLDWHKEHYEQMKDKFYVRRVYVCAACGKSFASTKIESRFCTNACKSAWRRKSGADNVTKLCELCGGEYIADKYVKSTRCKLCKHKGFTRSRQTRRI